MPRFNKIDRTLDKAELVCTKTDVEPNMTLTVFTFPLKFIGKNHNYEITLDEAIEEQTELRTLINKLNNDYNLRIPKKAKEKNRFSEYARKLSDPRDNVIDLFEKETFPYKANAFKRKKEESGKESEENKLKKIKDDCNKCFKYIEDESMSINYDLFEDYFNCSVPSALAKKLYETKDKNKNNDLVELIKVRWSNLKDKTKKVSKKEREIEKLDKILKIVKEIIEFNKQNQSGKGLKILIANQILSRLPISLAQLKARNNYEKLKNEIRQLLYSLYRSKKLTKQLYKSLVDH